MSSHITKVALSATPLLLALTLGLAGCTTDAAAPSSPTSAGDVHSALAAHGLEGLDARGVIDKLEATSLDQRPRDLMASIRPATLILTEQSGQVTELPMPADEFYLSVAPYQNSSHDCFFHSLTTCLGELRDAEVTVVVTGSTGEKILDQKLSTNNNGFVGIWLPRNIEGTLTITQDGKSATTEIATGDEDPTCLTTMKLG
ncbi:CueP family metal-binding protein [Mycetocola saprophilus]|uniref:CueP family metal-binding protein n=1 Tax=Mycetocola saprophilus TaxID=76636 RepID=UPI003BF3126D